ncbi:MAG: GNAT family N-acetyltransferase [Dehalococcoidia bacterium]|nr:GNAT family N-acetyltransferase [Dehalococcoidia bacterium]
MELVSMSSALIEALLAGQRVETEAAAGFKLAEGWPDPHDERFLRLRLRQMREDAAVQPWLVRAMVPRDRERGMLGHIGFHGPPDERGMAEMGYTVLPPFRRRGYALEAARGMMDWTLREHGVRLFRLSISPDNAPSLAMAAKMGFRQVGEQIDDEDGLELIFELDRA